MPFAVSIDSVTFLYVSELIGRLCWRKFYLCTGDHGCPAGEDQLRQGSGARLCRPSTSCRSSTATWWRAPPMSVPGSSPRTARHSGVSQEERTYSTLAFTSTRLTAPWTTTSCPSGASSRSSTPPSWTSLASRRRTFPNLPTLISSKKRWLRSSKGKRVKNGAR